MRTIAFVVNSYKMHLYYYRCLQAIYENFGNCKLVIIIDKTSQPIVFNFNKIINQVDHRFSNFQQNPIDSIDVENVKDFNYEIITDLEKLKFCDWIVLENSKFDCKLYESFTKNGFIALDFDIKTIKNRVVASNNIVLNILIKKPTDITWTNNQQIMQSEKGFRNNVYKILFNYNIYLVKLLQSDFANFNSPVIHYKSSVFKKLFYYCGLLLIIIKRKFLKQKLNWKIAIQKDNTEYFINQPENSFWADPFVVKHQDEIVVFFEELKPNKIGCISCAILDEDFKIKEKKVIIDKKYHLSFPYVFDVDGNYYMIPESSAYNNLDIYKCINFPFEWNFHSSMIKNIKLVDAVLLFHENKYWIFANKIEDFEHDNNEKLYLYYADGLFSGNWQSHLQNPIITNAGSARNAGKIYSENNRLYRVSQNCAHNYGRNVVVNEIIELSENNYKETKSKDVFCPKNYSGMHTINFIDEIAVVDYLIKE